MRSTYIAWAISALLLLVAAAWLGRRKKGTYLGFLLDERNEYSLTRFQLSLWTVVILSLATGVAVGRLMANVEMLRFNIPNELLIVIGISIGSGVLATGIKATHENRAVSLAQQIGMTSPRPRPVAEARFFNLLGTEVTTPLGVLNADAIDISKFQNFWITLLLVVAYIALSIQTLETFGTPSRVTGLPTFDGTFVVLLGISHAGYLAGKLPERQATV